MQTTIITSQKQCTGEESSSLVPSMISTSLGGAVIGGSMAQIIGALVGGVFGAFIALYSGYRNTKAATRKN